MVGGFSWSVAIFFAAWYSFHQLPCHFQKHPLSTLPGRNNSSMKWSNSPLYSNMGTSLEWWSIEMHVSAGLRVMTITFAPIFGTASPLQGARFEGAWVLITRLTGFPGTWVYSSGTHFVNASSDEAMETVISAHFDISMGSFTFELSPPASSVNTIYCINVVPHFGKVATTISPSIKGVFLSSSISTGFITGG